LKVKQHDAGLFPAACFNFKRSDSSMWNPFSRRTAEPEESPALSAAHLLLERQQQQRGVKATPVAGEHRVVSSKIAEVERIGQTAVATFTVTELTQEKGVGMLAELLEELGQTGAQHFVLDIQNVQFMDSACLGCLVEALNHMAKRGGKIALANTANSVQYLFKMTQLDRVFSICADVMAAIQAVEKVPGQDH
jgi:anti-sigma B factor antagonist